MKTFQEAMATKTCRPGDAANGSRALNEAKKFLSMAAEIAASPETGALAIQLAREIIAGQMSLTEGIISAFINGVHVGIIMESPENDIGSLKN